MSGPRPVSGIEYFGRPVDEWRRVAQLARRDLLLNPNDREAAEQLEDVKSVLRYHAGVVGELQRRARVREGRNLAEQSVAERPTQAQSFAASALNSASLGIGDEIAGLGALLPGGESPQQARDRFRAGRDALYVNPGSALAGNITGALLTGYGAYRALPFLWGMSPGRAGALIGGAEGVVRGAAGEGTLTERGTDAAVQGSLGVLIGGATGAIGGKVADRLRRWFPRNYEMPPPGEMTVAPPQGSTTILPREPVTAPPSGRVSVDDIISEGRPTSPTMIAGQRPTVVMEPPRSVGAQPSPTSDPVEQAFRNRARLLGIPEERIDAMRSAYAARAGQTPSQAADATHAVRPVRTNPEAPQVTAQGAPIPPILQGQVRVSAPGSPAPVVAQGPMSAPPRTAQGVAQASQGASQTAEVAPRSATQAQLAHRQGQIATGFLTHPPTPNASISIKALFANMPRAERLTAMDAFIRTRAPQGVHPEWNDILTDLRNLP